MTASRRRLATGPVIQKELDYLTSSHAAAVTFAENYVGLPLA